MKSLKIIIAFVVILGVNIGALYLFTAPRHSEVQQKVPAVDESPAADTSAEVVASMPADEAKSNMSRWIFALLRDNVTFAEIDSIYRQYEANHDAYRQLCDAKDCKMVEDYHSIKNLIENGCFVELSRIHDSQWSLTRTHKNLVAELIHRTSADYFKKHYREYKSFADMTVSRDTDIDAQAVDDESNEDKKRQVQKEVRRHSDIDRRKKDLSWKVPLKPREREE